MGGTFDFGGVTYTCFGIYKALVADLNDPTKHILLQELTNPCYAFRNSGSTVLAGLMTEGKIYVSFDYGETWADYIQPINFKTDVQKVWYNTLRKYYVSWYMDLIGIE